MAKLDAEKEMAGFLARCFFVVLGITVLLVSGLITLIRRGMLDTLFWLGVVVFGMFIVCLVALFFRFTHYLEEMKKS